MIMTSASVYLLICCFYIMTTTVYVVSEYLPFRDISLSWDKRVTDLVDRLTLDELVGTMARGGASAGPNIAIPRLGIPPFQFNTECLRGVVRPNLATAFPQSIGLSATFSPDLIKMMSTVIGTEARAIYHDAVQHGDFSQQKGISCFGPMINLLRHPLWGRAQEGYGEDPFLTGELTDAYVRGLQGDHPRYIRAGAGCKHFAVHSGPENLPSSRFSFDSEVSERDLQLTFLPHFKKCVDAGSLSLMCSYNSINGVPACGNKRFLTDILHGAWSFNGFVISDDGAIANIYSTHHYVKSFLEAAALAATAGVSLDLPSTANATYFLLRDAVRKGLVTSATIREQAKLAFRARMRLGQFDPLDLNPYSSIPLSVIQSEAHRKLALIAATKSFVLLKNDGGALPITSGSVKKLAIIGPMADNISPLFGDYSPAIDLKFSSTPYEGLRTTASEVVLEPGCVGGNSCKTYNASRIQQALLDADKVIVCLGLGYEFEEEDTDRADLSLPGLQDQLLVDVILYAMRPIVLLVFSGGPVDLSLAKMSSNVGAIIQCFYPAQAAGEALRQVLFTHPETRGRGTRGQVTSPAGRSPYTWPLSLDQIPPMTNYSMEGRTYRYFNGPGFPLYPFGYGLSYSQFNYSDLTINPAVVRNGDNITITVNVLNLGPYDSDEVTQVYVSWRDSPVRMPNLQMVAVARNMIEFTSSLYPLNVFFTADQLKIWDDTKGFILYTGIVDVYVGGQQPNQKTDVGSNVVHGLIKMIS